MAFANLFKTLSTSGEDPGVPHQSPHPSKHEKKRPILDEPQNDHKKKKKKKPYQHFNQDKTAKNRIPAGLCDYDNPGFDPRALANFHHRGRGHFNRGHGAFMHHTMDKKGQHQNFRNTAVFSQEMQQQNMVQNKKKNNKMSWQENANSPRHRGGFSNGRHWHQAGGRGGSRGRGCTRMVKNMQDPPDKRVRYMTQEFKDKNAVEVDGRLFCKFFLWDKCTKGEECQLEHGRTFNGMIKDACKFYIQGCCSKGDSCAYMHGSFPCKYFHIRGKCSKEVDCRFSHEPLTDITKALLDQAIQQEKDIMELARKAKQAEVPEVVVEQPSSPTVDLLLHPIRPQFYNSACPGQLPPGTEEPTGAEQNPDPPHIESASLSSDLPDPKLVSYSVEAVLGPTHSRPFPSLFGSNKDHAPPPSPPRPSPRPSVTADRTAVALYSVDAVLCSVKTAGGSYLTCARETHLPASPSLTFYGSDHSKEVPKPLRDSGPFHGKEFRMKPNTVQSNQAKAQPDRGRVIPSLNPDGKQADQPLPVSTMVPPDSQSSAEVNGAVIDSLSSTSTHTLPVQPEARTAKDTQKAFHSLFASPLNQQVLNPAAPSNPRNSVLKAGPVVANIGHNAHVSVRSLPQAPSGIQRAVAKLGVPSRSESPGCTPQAKACTLIKPTHCDQSASGRRKSGEKPHNSSIVSSVSDSDEVLPLMKIATDVTFVSCTSPEPSEVKRGIAAGGVLRSLFAIPIHKTAVPLPSAQGKTLACKPRPTEGSSENTTKTFAAVASLLSRPGPKHPNRKGPISRTNDHRPSNGPVQNDSGPRDVSSNAATTTATSVLKTLFLSLRPYDQEEQHEILSKRQGKNDVNHSTSSKDPPRTTEELKEEAVGQEPRATVSGGPAGRLLDPDHQLQGSCESTRQPTAAAPHQPVAKNPYGCSIESSGWHAPHTLLAQQNSIKRPLKNLFKTLDPSASPFGS